MAPILEQREPIFAIHEMDGCVHNLGDYAACKMEKAKDSILELRTKTRSGRSPEEKHDDA